MGINDDIATVDKKTYITKAQEPDVVSRGQPVHIRVEKNSNGGTISVHRGGVASEALKDTLDSVIAKALWK
jgi:hypothetical protein